MNVTEAGMVMEVKERLCANVIYPISVREPGSVTSVKVSQYEKAPLPMVSDIGYKYRIWQYTSTASVPGIAGGCDVNIAYGTR